MQQMPSVHDRSERVSDTAEQQLMAKLEELCAGAGSDEERRLIQTVAVRLKVVCLFSVKPERTSVFCKTCIQQLENSGQPTVQAVSDLLDTADPYSLFGDNSAQDTDRQRSIPISPGLIEALNFKYRNSKSFQVFQASTGHPNIHTKVIKEIFGNQNSLTRSFMSNLNRFHLAYMGLHAGSPPPHRRPVLSYEIFLQDGQRFKIAINKLEERVRAQMRSCEQWNSVSHETQGVVNDPPVGFESRGAGNGLAVERVIAVPDTEISDRFRIDESFSAVCASPDMREMFTTAAEVAKRDMSVLILGETGVGKDLVARVLHQYSGRTNKPFVAFNCTSVPDTLIESFLFGHKKGSYTNAHADNPGLLETVDGGTLFLDEIGELPLATQAKLLRVIEERKFRRIGDTNHEHTFEGRLVCATNKDLAKEVQAGTFRRDLLYRIGDFDLRIPPIRDRREDLQAMIDYFLAQCSDGLSPAILMGSARQKLLAHSFPGNVRELRGVINKAVIRARMRKETHMRIEETDIQFLETDGADRV